MFAHNSVALLSCSDTFQTIPNEKKTSSKSFQIKSTNIRHHTIAALCGTGRSGAASIGPFESDDQTNK